MKASGFPPAREIIAKPCKTATCFPSPSMGEGQGEGDRGGQRRGVR